MFLFFHFTGRYLYGSVLCGRKENDNTAEKNYRTDDAVIKDLCDYMNGAFQAANSEALEERGVYYLKKFNSWVVCDKLTNLLANLIV